jgi:hypothetical protein
MVGQIWKPIDTVELKSPFMNRFQIVLLRGRRRQRGMYRERKQRAASGYHAPTSRRHDVCSHRLHGNHCLNWNGGKG